MSPDKFVINAWMSHYAWIINIVKCQTPNKSPSQSFHGASTSAHDRKRRFEFISDSESIGDIDITNGSSSSNSSSYFQQGMMGITDSEEFKQVTIRSDDKHTELVTCMEGMASSVDKMCKQQESTNALLHSLVLTLGNNSNSPHQQYASPGHHGGFSSNKGREYSPQQFNNHMISNHPNNN
jgi:hypothetical protein